MERGNIEWKDGIVDSEVIFIPCEDGEYIKDIEDGKTHYLFYVPEFDNDPKILDIDKATREGKWCLPVLKEKWLQYLNK